VAFPLTVPFPAAAAVALYHDGSNAGYLSVQTSPSPTKPVVQATKHRQAFSVANAWVKSCTLDTLLPIALPSRAASAFRRDVPVRSICKSLCKTTIYSKIADYTSTSTNPSPDPHGAYQRLCDQHVKQLPLALQPDVLKDRLRHSLHGCLELWQVIQDIDSNSLQQAWPARG
jgi:hypothetical protein